jgi:serine/threonine protein kinase
MKINTTGMDPATFSEHWADAGKVTNNQSQHSGKSSSAPFQHGTLPPWLKGYEGGARAPERRPGWAGKKWPDPLTPVVAAPADLPSGPPVGQMTLGKEIGRGWDGVVREATDHDSPPKQFAVKYAFSDNALKTERDALTRLPAHPNLLKFYGERDGGLVLELLRGKTLAQHIEQNKIAAIHTPIESATRGVVIQQALQGMMRGINQMHAHGLVHADLTGRNVHVGEDGQTRLIDFARSKFLDNSNQSRDRSQIHSLVQDATSSSVPVSPLRGKDGKQLRVFTASGQAIEQLSKRDQLSKHDMSLAEIAKLDFFNDIPLSIVDKEREESIRSAEPGPAQDAATKAISNVFKEIHHALLFDSPSFSVTWSALRTALDLLPGLPPESRHIAEIVGEMTRAIRHLEATGSTGLHKEEFAELLEEFLLRDESYLHPIHETAIHPDVRGDAGFTPDEVRVITRGRQEQAKLVALRAANLSACNLLHAVGTQCGAANDENMQRLTQRRANVATAAGVDVPDEGLESSIDTLLRSARSWLPRAEKKLAGFDGKTLFDGKTFQRERPQEARLNPGTMTLAALQEWEGSQDPKGIQKAWKVLQDKGKSERKKRLEIAKNAEGIVEKFDNGMEQIHDDVAKARRYLDQLPLSKIGETDNKKLFKLRRDLSQLVNTGVRLTGLKRDWVLDASVNTAPPTKDEWMAFFARAQVAPISGRGRAL